MQSNQKTTRATAGQWNLCLFNALNPTSINSNGYLHNQNAEQDMETTIGYATSRIYNLLQSDFQGIDDQEINAMLALLSHNNLLSNEIDSTKWCDSSIQYDYNEMVFNSDTNTYEPRAYQENTLNTSKPSAIAERRKSA